MYEWVMGGESFPRPLNANAHTHLHHERSLAVGLLDEMAELGCPPGSVTFASAMLACERARQWQHVLRIMDQVQ